MKKKMLCFEIGNQIAKIYFVTIMRRKSRIDAFMMFDTPEDVVYDGNICDVQKFVEVFEERLKEIRKDNTAKVFDKEIKEKLAKKKELSVGDIKELGYTTVGMLVHSTKIIAKRERIKSPKKIKNKKVKDQILSEFPINKNLFLVFIEEQKEKLTFKEKRNNERAYILTAVPKKIMNGAKATADSLGMDFTGLNVVENVYDDSFAKKYKNITIVDIGMTKTVFLDVKKGRIINKKVIMYGAKDAVYSLIKNKVYDEESISKVIAKMEKRDCFNHGTDGDYEEEYKDSVVRKLHFLFEEIKENVLKTDIMSRRKKVVCITGIASHMCGLDKYLQRYIETDVKIINEGLIYVEEDKLIEQYQKIEAQKDNKVGFIHNSNRFAKLFLTACFAIAVLILVTPSVEMARYRNKLENLKKECQNVIFADEVKNAQWKELYDTIDAKLKSTDKITKFNVTTYNFEAVIQTDSKEDALDLAKKIEGGKVKKEKVSKEKIQKENISQLTVKSLKKDDTREKWFLNIEGKL